MLNLDVRYLTVSELIYINGTLLNKPEVTSGRQQIRDVGLLEAAVARPAASAFGQDAYPTLREKAAALLHSVARNHPFTDGNKRTATVGVVFMFRVNSQAVVWQREDALAMILGLAEGRATLETVAGWFPIVSSAYTLPPDSDADMQLIAQIIDEQKGLLSDLESR